jgi:UDP-N-acetylmuramate dehydrogenase
MVWNHGLRGSFKIAEPLAAHNWFQVGGRCLGMFFPADIEDLRTFLKDVPGPYRVLGAGSNVLIHDEGWQGYVVKLNKGFRNIKVEGHYLHVGAGALDRVVAQVAQMHGLSGVEFLYTIPGAIGGALTLNAGCYGHEIANIIEEVTLMTPEGELCTLSADALRYEYRQCHVPEGWIFLEARLRCVYSDPQSVQRTMNCYAQQRQATQPLQARTGGSTFKNPPGSHAWQWIDAVSGRGARLGDAQFSEKHCNFLINLGNASAQDLWSLASEIQTKVRLTHHIQLEWEVKLWEPNRFEQTQRNSYGLLAYN